MHVTALAYTPSTPEAEAGGSLSNNTVKFHLEGKKENNGISICLL